MCFQSAWQTAFNVGLCVCVRAQFLIPGAGPRSRGAFYSWVSMGVATQVCFILHISNLKFLVTDLK